MNKTLLLIICDFLLISILALVKFEPEVEDDTQKQQENLQEDAEREMVELLELSLDNEARRRKEAESIARAKESELETTQESLQETRQSLERIDTTRESLAREKATLEESLQERRAALEEANQKSSELVSNLTERERRLARMQEELQKAQETMEEKERSLQESQQKIEELAQRQQELQTNLKIEETEKKILRENLTAAKTEVDQARVEAEKARERAEKLATGVSDLAASSTELTRKIEEGREISMNEIFDHFRSAQSRLAFRYRQQIFLGYNDRSLIVNGVVLNIDGNYYAAFATPGTPFEPKTLPRVNDLQGAFQFGDRQFRINQITYLSEDRNLAGVRIPESLWEENEIGSFALESNPTRFSNAVLIDNENNYYSEFPIKLAPESNRRLRMEDKLSNRLFGEFSPSQGDYLFSKSGHFMGVMINNSEALLFEDLTPGESISLGDEE